MGDCPFCGDIPSETREDMPTTRVTEYGHWTVLLHFNQYYLGRCIVALNRHIVDLFELQEEERRALFEMVVPDLRAALTAVFDPDLFNYAALGNQVRHLHLHVIPRYASPREFAGERFEDERWGRNYKPYPKPFDIPDEAFNEIRDRLRDAIR